MLRKHISDFCLTRPHREMNTAESDDVAAADGFEVAEFLEGHDPVGLVLHVQREDQLLVEIDDAHLVTVDDFLALAMDHGLGDDSVPRGLATEDVEGLASTSAEEARSQGTEKATAPCTASGTRSGFSPRYLRV